MKFNVCKICRRQGQKLFLKGDKCVSPKCPFAKRPYPPGIRKTRGKFSVSEYGKELLEKQKLKNYYGLSEKQFSRYVSSVLGQRSKDKDAVLLLAKKLESRFDNAVFKMGFSRSRKEARKLISHKHFLINKKSVNIPSYIVKIGDKIEVKENKKQKNIFKNLIMTMKNYQPPKWMKVDKKNLAGEITGEPYLDEVSSSIDISSIFEFYSR